MDRAIHFEDNMSWALTCFLYNNIYYNLSTIYLVLFQTKLLIDLTSKIISLILCLLRYLLFKPQFYLNFCKKGMEWSVIELIPSNTIHLTQFSFHPICRVSNGMENINNTITTLSLPSYFIICSSFPYFIVSFDLTATLYSF
jgi:hypothetical protein